MIEQIKQIIEQVSAQEGSAKGLGSDVTSAVTKETGESILSGLKSALTGGNISQLTDLFQGNVGGLTSNPVVMGMIANLVSSLTGKLGLDQAVSQNFAGSVIPKVMETLVSKAQDGKESGFQMTDLIASLSGGSDAKGLLESLGGSLGLDQNKDGKLGLDDAMFALKGFFK